MLGKMMPEMIAVGFNDVADVLLSLVHDCDIVATKPFARRLKTLSGSHVPRVHLRGVCFQVERITFDPLQQMPGPNI